QRVARQRLTQIQSPRLLVIRERPIVPLDQPREQPLSPAVGALDPPDRRDASHDLLAPLRVRDPHNGDLADLGVAEQRLLDLPRGDLEPARLDDIDGAAPDDLEVAALIDLRNIARAKPRSPVTI